MTSVEINDFRIINDLNAPQSIHFFYNCCCFLFLQKDKKAWEGRRAIFQCDGRSTKRRKRSFSLLYNVDLPIASLHPNSERDKLISRKKGTDFSPFYFFKEEKNIAQLCSERIFYDFFRPHFGEVWMFGREKRSGASDPKREGKRELMATFALASTSFSMISF